MGGKDRLPATDELRAVVADLVARARAAQRAFDSATQERVDEVVTAVGWAIVEPARNRALAERAVRDTGLGNVEDKIAKNRRKTIGLLRDLAGAKSVGIIAEDPERGLTEIARPVGVVGALTPSTNPAATPANNIINALKGRNTIIIAPSPRGASTFALLLEFVHAELARVGAPLDLVQVLPPPVTREATAELMRQVDLVVATGSQTNVRAAYASGTPAIGVGTGNVAVIVDETADLADAADKIARSKVFDNATSCSSENSLIVLDAVRAPLLKALAAVGGALLDREETRRLDRAMFPGRLLRHQGAGHSIGLHTSSDERAMQLGLALPVCRVIVNQAHCFATGGSFDNALPFSLSMGCGTWGRNSISDNLNYRHFLNVTRVVRPLPGDRVDEPSEERLFGAYLSKYGAKRAG